MKTTNRRHFLRNTALTSTALALPGHTVLGANESIRVAVIGIGGRGGLLMKEAQGCKDVEVVALCDADRDTLNKRANEFEKKYKRRPDTEQDFRKLLERDDIDAVVSATPNHWHALLTIYACQAGKDVYIEKPVSHGVYEGRKMVEASRKYDRIVQGGFQNRSHSSLQEFKSDLDSGRWGKIEHIRGLCYRNRSSIGARTETPQAPPAAVDYNLWLGPADDLPIHRKRFHYDWHWIWNTGNGDLGNQGPHEFDLLCWFLGDPGLPKQTMSFGGRFGWNDAGETHNLQLALLDFGKDKPPAAFEVCDMRLKPDLNASPHYKGTRVGVIVTCEGGEFRGGRGGGTVYAPDGKAKLHKYSGGGNHMANFFEAVRSRKRDKQFCEIEKAHLSCCLPHFGNISARIGAATPQGELREKVKGDPRATEWLDRFAGQLNDWKVDLDKTPFTLGPWLPIDAKNECVADSPFAKAGNALVRRRGRGEFIIPEKV